MMGENNFKNPSAKNPAEGEGKRMERVCSGCQKKFGEKDGQGTEGVTHGYCPECLKKEKEKTEKWGASSKACEICGMVFSGMDEEGKEVSSKICGACAADMEVYDADAKEASKKVAEEENEG